MSNKTNLFADLFRLWLDGDKPSAGDMGRDMDVPRTRAAQWINRGSLPPAYWRQFIEVLARKFKVVVTLDDLVDASSRQGMRRLAGATKTAVLRRARSSAQRNREASP